MCYSVDKSAGPREVAVMGQVAALYSGRNPKVRLYMLYEIQPTGPARRLATQQVGYDQKGKSAVQRRRLQQHSQYHFLDGAT